MSEVFRCSLVGFEDSKADVHQALQTLCREVSTSLDKAAEQWSTFDRLDLVEDLLDIPRSQSNIGSIEVKRCEVRNVRVQSPR